MIWCIDILRRTTPKTTATTARKWVCQGLSERFLCVAAENLTITLGIGRSEHLQRYVIKSCHMSSNIILYWFISHINENSQHPEGFSGRRKWLNQVTYQEGTQALTLDASHQAAFQRFQCFTESSLKKSGAMWCDAKLAKSVWCIIVVTIALERSMVSTHHLTHFPKHDYQRRDIYIYIYIQWYKIEYAVDVTVLPGHPHCLESCPFPHLVIIGLKLLFVFWHCRLPSSLCCRHSVPISVEMLGTAKELWM